MQHDQSFPYPTHIEIIRAITNTLDVKHSNKTLDDRAQERSVDPRHITELLQDCLYTPLRKIISESNALRVTISATNALESYSKLTGTLNADGLTRDDMLPLLTEFFACTWAARLLNDLYAQTKGPTPVTLLIPGDNAVSVTLEWLEKNDPEWLNYQKSLNKEQRDRLRAWKKDELPSSQSITLLPQQADADVDWIRAKTLLLTARAIEHSKKINPELTDTIRLQLWGANPSSNIETETGKKQEKTRAAQSALLPHVHQAASGLRLKTTKSKDDQERLKAQVLHIREKLESHPKGHTTLYWIDWYEARWHVLSGNLDTANKLYKKALHRCLYRAGVNQKAIIYEALTIAANQVRPDKVFLKHLKWACLMFGYDLPSNSANTPSTRFEDSIEEWELVMWKNNYNAIFPQKGHFPGGTHEVPEPRVGPLFCPIEPDAIKADYRHPDRVLKIGETWKKRIPQLVWFTIVENFEAVDKLLAKGASVDCTSDSNDTAIMAALETMDVTSLPVQSLDNRFFELLSKHPHTAKTMNTRSQKKRLLPLILAVNTGQPDIVKRVLEMGANPDGRGETDEITALCCCLRYINILVSPDQTTATLTQRLKRGPQTAQALDSIRRQTNGLLGPTLEAQTPQIDDNYQARLLEAMHKAYPKLYVERVTTYMSLPKMHQIARYLLESGASPNALHSDGISEGYTPLLMAAETNDREIFELMLQHGGNPNISYQNRELGKLMNCWDVAMQFGSNDILDTLKHYNH